MPLDTIDIQDAIVQHYADTSALNTLTADTDSMFLGQGGRRNATCPYIAFELAGGGTQVTFGALTKDIETIALTFTVIDDARSSAATAAILEQIDTAYGISGGAMPFGASTYNHLSTMRTGFSIDFDPESGKWVGVLTYQLHLQRIA